MKKIYSLLLLLCTILLFISCSNGETYSDLKEAERDAINRYISEKGIKVIGEEVFEANNQTTDVNKNEYVYLPKSAVYMQIVRKGCGSQIEENKQVEILCRFSEYNIKADSMLIRNDIAYGAYIKGIYYDLSAYPEKMSVTRVGMSYTASFVADNSVMYAFHGSASVPSGWLVPLSYINIGRPEKAGDEVAKVRLIVPHTQGTPDASSSVYPCFYEITYERDI
ncbi:MAG: DUF4827 domain-containing protein [Prevotella sp.]|nr:DUF4827 domain-containing protein [Prevotella sp.]